MCDIVSKRLYVGGLPKDVSSNEILERFSRFGKINNLKLTQRTDDEGNQVKSFAHLDIEGDEGNIKKCFSTYQNVKWKGSVLKLQYAKESFLARLEKEREEPVHSSNDEQPVITSSPAVLPAVKSSSKVNGAKGSLVPGTPVPGKKDWVVGKYGRELPVLKLKKSYKIKMLKHDPSKHCHAATVFKDDKMNSLVDTSCDKLTWELDTPDSEITKKRKGLFPQESTSVKKRKETLSPLKQQNNSFSNSSSHRSHLGTEDLEIVKGVSVQKFQTPPSVQTSNKFDSDFESDSESLPSHFDKNMQVKSNAVKLKGIPSIPGSSQKSTYDLTINGAANSQKHSGHPKAIKNNMETDRKIPEFKGIQMLGLEVAMLKTDEAAHRKEKLHNTSDDKLKPNPTATKLHDAKVGNVNEKFNKSVVSNAKSARQSPPNLIPEFRGLGMLSDLSDFVGKTANKDRRKSANSSSQQQSSPVKNKGSSSLTASAETYADNLSLTTQTKKTDGYDSASSADTDEILVRCKEKQGMSSSKSSLPLTPNNGKGVQTSTRNVPCSPITPKKTTTTPLSDYNLVLSEYTAGTPELSGSSFTASKEKDVLSDSYDSDLDSNDFELVAKKLAAKAAKTSGSLGKKSIMPKKHGSSGKAIGAEVDSSLLDHKEAQMTGRSVKVDEAARNNGGSTKSFIQAKLKGIADGSDISAVAGKNLTEVSKEHKDNKKSRKSKESASDIVLESTSPQNFVTNQKTKQLTDNEKRLQAVREQVKQRQQKQSLMTKALQNVDSQDNSSNKRIVFNSDEESSSESDDNESNLGSGDDYHGGGAIEKQKAESTKKKTGLTLLDSSDDEDDEDYEEMFKSKPHFEGKKGERLMKLEKKIGDSRFKLDAKFAESDSEEENEEKSMEVQTERTEDDDLGLVKEKAASLKVLENVIGKTTLDHFTEKLKRNTKHMIDMNTVRFDPTKMTGQSKSLLPESKKVMPSMIVPKAVTPKSDDAHASAKIKSTPKSDNTHASDKTNSTPKSDETHASDNTKSKVHMTSSLVDLFKNKGSKGSEDESQGFSLLKQFDAGSAESDSDVSGDDGKDDTTKPPVLSALFKKTTTKAADKKEDSRVATSLSPKNDRTSFLGKEDVKDDSSEDEDTEDESDEGETDQEGMLTSLVELTNEMMSGDNSDDEALENVADRSHEDGLADYEFIDAGRPHVRFTKDQWLQRWEEIRPVIVKIYKRKHKDALKNKRAQSEVKRRREFLKKSKKGHWSGKKR